MQKNEVTQKKNVTFWCSRQPNDLIRNKTKKKSKKGGRKKKR